MSGVKVRTTDNDTICKIIAILVGPCHHGIARPQVADRGTASDKAGSCEQIVYAVADSRRGMVLQLGGWARCSQPLSVKTNVQKHSQAG